MHLIELEGTYTIIYELGAFILSHATVFEVKLSVIAISKQKKIKRHSELIKIKTFYTKQPPRHTEKQTFVNNNIIEP
jgi:hypothetical protein